MPSHGRPASREGGKSPACSKLLIGKPHQALGSSGADPQEAHLRLRWKVQGGGRRQAVPRRSLNDRPPAHQERREMRGTFGEYSSLESFIKKRKELLSLAQNIFLPVGSTSQEAQGF